MRIYDKKKFIFGIMALLLGVCLLVLGFLKGFDGNRIFLMILLSLIGISEIYLSINREAAKQEKFEQTEERNLLIALTAKSKAFDLMQSLGLALVFLFLIVGKQLGQEPFISMGVGAALVYAISMFSEILSRIYYERHM